MSILSVTELIEDKGGQLTVNDNTTDTEITRKFLVLTDSTSHDPQYILATSPAFGVPVEGNTHPSNSGAYVNNRDARLMEGSASSWGIVVQYSTQLKQGQGGGPSVTRSITTRKVQEVIRFDEVTGKLIMNSANIPFDTRNLTFPRSHRVATYTRTENSFDENVADQFVDHVNSTSWKGKQKESVWCQDISAQEVFTADEAGNLIPKWTVTYVFEHNPRTWKHFPLNEGFVDKDGLPITNAEGDVYTEPWPLDANGYALTEAEVAAGTKISSGEFSVFQLANFNGLNL
jgi:hypothetical protein